MRLRQIGLRQDYVQILELAKRNVAIRLRRKHRSFVRDRAQFRASQARPLL